MKKSIKETFSAHFLIFNFLLVILLVPQSLWASAREVKFKDYVLELQDDEKLVIQGLRGSVKIVPNLSEKSATGSGAKTLTLKVKKALSAKSSSLEQTRFESASFAVKREAGLVIVEIKGPASAEEWASWAESEALAFHFEVEAPAVSTDVILRDGQVSIQGFKQPVSISVINGSIKASGTEGPMRINIQKGDLKVENHRGRVEVDSYSARVNLNEIEGEVQITNFAGESAIASVKGNIEMSTNSGATSISKSAGAVRFLAGRGNVNLQDFEGAVRGEIAQGTVTAELAGEADVNVESEQGPVILRMPANSGAYLRIQSEEGAVNAPDPLKATNTSSGSKLLSGRLNGQGPKGSVQVKTKTGNVRVK